MNTNKHINSIIINGGGALTSRKLAFSLAEVTLAVFVLGIIAAETIPVLLKDYQKKVWETQYKTAYSIIKQATTNIMADNGGTIAGVWSEADGTDEFFQAYKPYLKIAQECTYPLTSSNCFPSGYELLDGTTLSVSLGKHGVLLTNSIALGFNAEGSSSADLVYVDINGPKGPNLWGKDFHRIHIHQSGEFSNDPVRPDKFNWSQSYINNQCPPDLSSGKGSSCGVRILRGDYGEEY